MTISPVDYPWLLFAGSFVLVWLAAQAGFLAAALTSASSLTARDDLTLVRNATFTLLSVLIGFSLSMAVARYDLRKTYEEEEANAIGTEYLRLDLLPMTTSGDIRALLRDYTHQRIIFYTAFDPPNLQRAADESARLQDSLWVAVSQAAVKQPSPVSALAVAGMNEVINSQGHALAAWRNRLPLEVWGLMLAVAMMANFQVGFGATSRHSPATWTPPLLAAIAFLLIADADSARNGLVRVDSQTLLEAAALMEKGSR